MNAPQPGMLLAMLEAIHDTDEHLPDALYRALAGRYGALAASGKLA